LEPVLVFRIRAWWVVGFASRQDRCANLILGVPWQELSFCGIFLEIHFPSFLMIAFSFTPSRGFVEHLVRFFLGDHVFFSSNSILRIAGQRAIAALDLEAPMTVKLPNNFFPLHLFLLSSYGYVMLLWQGSFSGDSYRERMLLGINGL
jgi:hypothetical protein